VQILNVRRFLLILSLGLFGLLAIATQADTFKLNNGETLTGEVLSASANDEGVQVKLGEGEYKRVPWSNFSQEDLKKLAENKKMAPFVEPFIEVSREEKMKKTEVDIKEPSRLSRPSARSFFGAMFSSGVGLLVMLLLYAANIYSAFEIAIFRAQPVPLVCAVAAVLPIIGPIIFLVMPTKMQAAAPTWDVAPERGAEGAAAPAGHAPAETADASNPMLAEGAAHPSGLRIAHNETEHHTKSAHPPTQTFQRGEFTFNRRFFETKFAGFFGVVRRDAEKDMVLLIKSARGQHAGDRITRIAANDLHLQIHKGSATEEVMIPFQDIKEIQLKHKNAP
jgi:hypothetical protein